MLGLNGVPEAGLEFSAIEDEKAARALAEQRGFEARASALEAKAKVTLENLFDTLDAQQGKALKLVVKADTQGSVEAIVDALKKIESDKVALEVIHSAVGTITESDALLASASNAVVLGFHTRIDTGVGDVAKREGVQIKLYTIIYELIDEVKEAMAGLLDPIAREVVTGSAEVKQVFELSKGAPVAGCAVSSGRIVRGKIRVRRRKELIYEGVTQSLRRFQDEVNEVRAGMECGIRVEGFGDFQVGDVLECYLVEKIAQKL
jgi:translation initiation factor IF-2